MKTLFIIESCTYKNYIIRTKVILRINLLLLYYHHVLFIQKYEYKVVSGIHLF